jgi:iron complex outermembrane receptor protein
MYLQIIKNLHLLAAITVALTLLVTGTAAMSADGNELSQQGTGAEDLPAIFVQAELPKEGSAEAGYKAETTKNLGLWGDRKILDTPYSMFEMSEEFIENVQAGHIGDLLKRNPLVMYSGDGYLVNSLSSLNTRGFYTNRTFANGLAGENIGAFVEDIDSVQVISGLSGFIYGPANVGGLINYSTKRPVPNFMAKLTLGDYGGGQYYGHADLGGPVLKDKLNFRFNALYQDGGTVIEDQELKRWMVSGALDWHITDDLLIQFDAAYRKFEQNGRQNTFQLYDASLPWVPEPMDGGKLWAPKDSFIDMETLTAGVGLKYHISDNFNLRMAYSHKQDTREGITLTGWVFRNNNQDFRSSFAAISARYIYDSAYAYLDTSFNTFGIDHTLTIGVNGYFRETQSGLGGFSQIGPQITLPIHGYNSSTQHNPGIWDIKSLTFKKTAVEANYNFLLGDDIKINDQWSVLAGLNWVHFDTQNYSASGSKTTSYVKSAVTPTVSVLFKPQPNITSYITYMESLEQGQIVGQTYQNAGEILKPLSSYQYELGIKADVSKMLLTLALFHIDKSLQYSHDGTNTGRYVQDGRQVHQGIEFTLQGKLFDDLALYGGATYLRPKIKKTNDPRYAGKEPNAVSKVMGKLYSEYNAPFLDGLTFTGGIYYMGSAYADRLNTKKIKAYTTGDLGLRYTTDYFGFSTTFRLNVTNITNERYWAAVSNETFYLAQPRTLMFSVTAAF